MKEKLQIPYAEEYEIESPQNINNRKLNEFLEKQLKVLHPGFSSDSLWDYVVILRNNKKILKVIVFDKNIFIEKKIKNSKIEFYIEENNKKYFLFSSKKFSKTGQKKNFNYLLFTFLCCLFICIPVLLLMINKKAYKKTEIIVEETEEKEIPEICNTLDIINFTAGKILEEKGIVTNLNYSLAKNAQITFVINNCEPYNLINKILLNTKIQNCYCSNLAYKDSTESFEIQIDVPMVDLLVEQKNGLELLEIQKNIISIFKEEQIQVVSSSINQEYCKVNYLLCVNRKDLEKINNILVNLQVNSNFFITSFNEQVLETNECIIEFEVIVLNKKQVIKTTTENDEISKVMYVAQSKKENPENKKIISSEKEISKIKNINKISKIGSVVKNGTTFYYYRTEDGKIYTSKEEL